MELTFWQIIGMIVLIVVFLFILFKAIWIVIKYTKNKKSEI